jgi:hypothetical protein
MKLIGLSLSICIKDIIEGRRSKDEVHYIVSDTSFRNETEFQEVLDTYKKSYWRRSPEVAESIAREFFEEGKIWQPKLHNEEHPRASYGFWVITPEGG